MIDYLIALCPLLTFPIDFINSFNHTVSGSFSLANRHKAQPLSPGKSCVANAMISQFSVQAIDFNILIISIVVLLCIRQPKFAVQPSMKKTVLLCAIAWIPGLITSKSSVPSDTLKHCTNHADRLRGPDPKCLRPGEWQLVLDQA